LRRESTQKAVQDLKRQTDLYREELRQKLAEGKQMSSHVSDLKRRCEDRQSQLEVVRAERVAML